MSRVDKKTKRRKATFSLVAQEHSMGCAVACVASRCGITYSAALNLFSRPEHAWTRGYYCDEIVEALARAGFQYEFAEFDASIHAAITRRAGTIVFVAHCEAYPLGHFLVRTPRGWMNPWANFPRMVPVQAKVQRELPGEVGFVIYEGA